jgi:hypothetical protein
MGRFLNRFRPSPALALAFVALCVALAGSATALRGGGGVDAQGLRHWAVINQNGALVRGDGVRSVNRPSTGAYHIVFNRNVRNCVYLATLGRTGPQVAPPGEIGTGGLPATVRGIWVRTRNSAGNLSNRDFHVAIGC